MAKKLADNKKSAAEREPAAGAIIPVQTRSDRPKSTKVSDFPELSTDLPDWKLSPVSQLRSMSEDALEGSAYDASHETIDGFHLGWKPVSDIVRGEVGLPDNRLGARAWSEVKEVLNIEIEGFHDEPLYLTRKNLGNSSRASHILIRVRSSARAVMVLESRGQAKLFENVEILVEEGADFQLITLQDWSLGSAHVAFHYSKILSEAKFSHISISLGGDLVIVNPSSELSGSGAQANLFGAYFADQNQHLEHRVFVHHVAPQTRSRVNYKGALSGAGARTVWIGDVLIGSEAVGTDSYEQNRNLVLSEGTRADSIPNLEIKTGDIAGAGHASATARFDDEQLFYLQSRGIGPEEARKLVVMGFLMEIISKISDQNLAARLRKQIHEKMIKAEG